MRLCSIAATVLVLLFAGVGRGAAADLAPGGAAPVVVELFTSQSCSSCPPADELLAELARTRPDILALDMHVTYWDRLGWKDPFSLPGATDRQRRYAALWRGDTVYTPQIVVAGRHQAIGSDRPAVLAAIASAKADTTPAVPLRLARDAAGLVLEAGIGQGAGTFWLVGYDPGHTTAVRGGENVGRTLTEVNVVRSMETVGVWQGKAVRLHLPSAPGERTAVLLQAADGRMLGAATLPRP